MLPAGSSPLFCRRPGGDAAGRRAGRVLGARGRHHRAAGKRITQRSCRTAAALFLVQCAGLRRLGRVRRTSLTAIAAHTAHPLSCSPSQPSLNPSLDTATAFEDTWCSSSWDSASCSSRAACTAWPAYAGRSGDSDNGGSCCSCGGRNGCSPEEAKATSCDSSCICGYHIELSVPQHYFN